MASSNATAQTQAEEVHRHVNRLAQLVKEGFSWSGYERDALYLNLGTKRFLDISGVSGIDSITDGRGAVYADFDNDGDFDVFLPTIQGQVHRLFRNNVGQDASWIRVALEGSSSNRDAIGTIVRVKFQAGIQTKIKSGGEGFMSQHDPRLLFGLGSDTHAEWLEVTWPSGLKQRFENIPAGSSLKITEGQDGFEKVAEQPSKLPDPVTRSERELRALKIRLGQPFPQVEVTTLDGRREPLSSLAPKQRKILVNLWATWCAACSQEMPELERLRDQLRDNQIEVIGLSLDTVDSGVVAKFLKKRGISYPVFLADENVIQQIYVGDQAAVPLSILIDESGKVSEIFVGWSKQSLQHLESLAGLGVESSH
jgi:peroxiredoxin